MRHIDDTHQTKNDGQPQRHQQQNSRVADTAEELHPKNFKTHRNSPRLPAGYPTGNPNPSIQKITVWGTG